MTFSPAYCSTPATAGNPFACWGLVPTLEADVPEGCVKCQHPTMQCVGGVCVHVTGTNNGHAVGKGPLGKCYECGGKGWQDAADRKRNRYYWDHRPLSEWM